MSQTEMVCLLSEQLVPNYQLVKALRPQRVWRVLTEKTLDTDHRRFRPAVAALGISAPDCSAWSVDAHHATPTRDLLMSAVLDRPDADWVFVITGGTKPMACGAYLAAQQLKERDIGVRVLYVDFDKPGYYCDAESGQRSPMSAEIQVREYLSLYGVDVQSESREPRQEWRVFSSQWCEHAPHQFPIKITDQISRWRQEGCTREQLTLNKGFPPVLSQAWQTMTAGFADRIPFYVMRLATGDFLDTFLADLLRQHQAALGIDEVLTGVQDASQERGANVGEVDLYISRLGQLAVVECKSGRQHEQDVRAQIDNLAAKVRKIGARKTVALMCSTAEALNGDSVEGRFLREYAARMKVGLLLREDIQALARQRDDGAFVTRRLKDWLELAAAEINQARSPSA